MNNFPNGTVTFLFTDIEGSTKLAQQYPDQWEALRERHHAILQAAMDAHHGYVFQIIGDAFCVAFHTATDALHAAVKSQMDLWNQSWDTAPIKVRMGIHTGKAAIQENGEYQGYLSMSRVQRLMSAAHGGQVLISLATEELVRDELLEHVSLRDMGEKRLKDLIRSEHIYQLVISNLPAEFPPIKTLDAYRHNLPSQMTSFIGREKEMAEIKHAIGEHRLVTLTGSGGTGKTRLSLQVAADLLDQFQDGVWFIELAPLTNPDLISQTILSLLGGREQQGRTASQTLADYMREKNLLLVLDNCEHLIESCAQLADAMLKNTPAIKILATSREALGVKGELKWHVPSLSLPDARHLPRIDQLSQYEAVQLFIERALLAHPHFMVTKDNAPAIAQICSRLDGIPLAVELAAARVKTMGIDQISARLDDRFRLLTGGARTSLPRQQTLRATIDWSYNLLSEAEKILLRRLAVFVGGWTLEAAESVCGGEGNDFDVLDLLSHLVDKSLVIVEELKIGTRYHMLETTRQYAQEKLLHAEESESIRKKHCDWFLVLAERAEPYLTGGSELLDWLNRLEFDHDNMRAALAWAQITDEFETGARLAFALTGLWEFRVYLREGRKWLERSLAQREFLSKTLLAKTLSITRRFASKLGDYQKAEAYGRESVALFRELGDKPNLAWALRGLGGLYLEINERERGEPLLIEAMSLFQEVGDKWGILYLLIDLSFDAIQNGEYERAMTLINEHQTLAHEFDDVSAIGKGLEILGVVEFFQGNIDKSEQLLRKVLILYRPFGYLDEYIYCLELLAAVADRRRQPVRAARLWGAARHLHEITGLIELEFWIQRIQEPTTASLRAQLGESAFEAACAEGYAMTTEEAIDYALEETNE
jgi:predicted ATPase/class 3 adenylate cyclase